MSMHLAGPGLTTTSYKKRKQKVTKAQEAELERGWRERNIRLRGMGLPKETLEQYKVWVYGLGKKTKTKENTRAKVAPANASSRSGIPQTSEFRRRESIGNNVNAGNIGDPIQVDRQRAWVTGPVSSKPSPTYTGTQVIGIAVMHKSCLQPVFSQEAAEDSAKMRR